MTIILDTGFIFALKAKHDKYHVRALEILPEIKKNENELIITNELVINEVLTLAVARSKASVSFMNIMYELIWGKENFFNIVQLIEEDYKNIYIVLKKYMSPNLLLSFVDASLIFLYKKYNAKYLVSFDSQFDNIVKKLC